MTGGHISNRVSELSERIGYLKERCISNPAKAAEVLSDALEELQISLEELSAAEEELLGQNEQLIEANEEREKNIKEIEGLAKFPWENPNPVLRVSDEGVIIYANPSSAPLLKHLYRQVGQRLPEYLIDLTCRALKSRRVAEVDLACGETVYSLAFAPIEGRDYINIYGKDITEHKRSEEKIQAINDILKIINNHTKLEPLLKDCAKYLNKLTHCDAIGIRILDDEGNIPYQAYLGFSRDFYELESPLSIMSDKCMCINVIKGETDPSLPFYTKGGSFYMNGTTRFLATVSEEAKGETRSICNKVGYESVALVPISVRDNILGLIHLADTRENMVPLNTIETIEGIAMQLGVAIERVQAQQALQEAKDHLEIRVKERTEELESANCALQEEIADRKLAEEAVKAERQMFNNVLDTLPAYLVLLTPDYHVPFANRFFRERFGESKGRPCFEYLFGRSEPCEICETYSVLKTGEPHHWEWTGPDGHNYDIFDYPFTDTDGSTLIMEVGIDITERKRAEEALRVAGAYNRSLIEASLDPLVTIGPDGKITDVNAATEAVTGYDRGELIGTDFSEYFTEADNARSGYERVFRDGLVRDYALEIRHRSGHITPVLYNASIYRNDAGRVIGVFAAARDITERKLAEAELAEQRRKELDRLAELEKFQRLTVGRELKMVDLKKEIEKLTKANEELKSRSLIDE